MASISEIMGTSPAYGRNDSWLFYADTPLQVVNAASIASELSKFGIESDLMFEERVAGSGTFIHALSKNKVFNAATVIRKGESDNVGKFRRFLCYLVNRKVEYLHFERDYYSHFALACPNMTTLDILASLRKDNGDLSTILYEDGTGSYTGAVFLMPQYLDKTPAGLEKRDFGITDKIKRSVKRLTLGASGEYRPQALLVKKPELIRYPVDMPVFSFDTARASLKSIDKVRLPKVDGKKTVVFLDVLRNEASGNSAGTIDALLEDALTLDCICAYRSHPRSEIGSPHAARCHDCNDGIWELQDFDNALENVLLIGEASTAMITPAIEAGAKPYLMFVGIASDAVSEQASAAFRSIYQIAEQLYGKDNAKLLFPASLDEAKSSLRSWVSQD